jgi:hypothetical protein
VRLEGEIESSDEHMAKCKAAKNVGASGKRNEERRVVDAISTATLRSGGKIRQRME